MFFNVGDVVKLKSGNYYSTINCNKTYKVFEIKFNNSGNQLIKLDAIYGSNFYTASNFELVTAVNPDILVTPGIHYNYVVLDSSFTLLARSINEQDAYTVVDNLLRKNPEKKYHVYKYDVTGSLPKLPVEWIKNI